MTRRRYRVDPKTGDFYEVELDAPVTPRLELVTDGHYEGLRSTDGVPIDTRKRHREYMKARGLALYDDFKQTRAEAPIKREAAEDAARVRGVERALWEVTEGPRRKRG